MFKSSLRLSVCFFLSFLSLSCAADTAVNNVYQDGITLTITNKIFDKKAHKIQNCPKAQTPCIIDGKIFYGGNGLLPKVEVASLVFSQNGKKVYLDVSSIYDTGVTNSNIKKYISIERWSSSYRIVGYLGAGEDKGDGGDEPYIAHWLVMPNGSVRNHLGDYESLVSLVFKVNKDFNISQ